MSNSHWDGISMPYSASGISRRLYAPAATLSNSQPTQTAQGAQRLCLIPNFAWILKISIKRDFPTSKQS